MPTQDDMDSGDCCMARHAKAIPPWKCDCPCHSINKYINSELTELQEKEDIRKKYLELRASFGNLASAYHSLIAIQDRDVHKLPFMECDSRICQINREILERTKI